jgi:hypothetical protein
MKALDTVKQFIIEKKLLLTGGMAIDMSLKTIGREGIYGSDTLPDYDFFSPKFHEHAYELGYILCQQGMPHVTIINAIHILTMKVRVNFDVVADITYMDPKIFNEMKFIDDDSTGIRIIHPYFIMSTQYYSLSNPFNGYPREAIMQRWKKDMKRLSILQDGFPVSKPDKIPRLTEYKFPFDKLPDKKHYAIAGWAAVQYWQTYAEEPTNAAFSPYQSPLAGIEIITTELELFLPKAIKYYNPYIDIIQRSIEITDGIRVFDTYGIKYSAYYDKRLEIHIVCPTWLMYKALLEIIHNINVEENKLLYGILQDLIMKEANAQSAAGPYILSPLLPYPFVYGDKTESQNYFTALSTFIEETVDDTTATTATNKYNFMLPPIVSMSTKCIIPESVKNFDIKTSLFFQSDYQETKPFHVKDDRIVPPLPHSHQQS